MEHVNQELPIYKTPSTFPQMLPHPKTVDWKDISVGTETVRSGWAISVKEDETKFYDPAGIHIIAFRNGEYKTISRNPNLTIVDPTVADFVPKSNSSKLGGVLKKSSRNKRRLNRRKKNFRKMRMLNRFSMGPRRMPFPRRRFNNYRPPFRFY